jgi:hypothetical protein
MRRVCARYYYPSPCLDEYDTKSVSPKSCLVACPFESGFDIEEL